MKKTAVTLATALAFTPALASAADYYVDPSTGSMAGDGSMASPWSTVEEVIGAGLVGTTVQAGDRLLLRSGYHGELVITEGAFDPAVAIVADDGAAPQVRRIRTSNVSGLVVGGLSVSPSYAASYETLTMVDIQGSSSNIVVRDCEIFSERDVSGWGADEWINRASNGIQVSGDDVVIRNNTVTNVRFGISVSGARARVVRNTIDAFSADGLRGLGDYGVFEHNVVKNVYVDGDLDGNHDDGFQSWSVGDGGVGTGEVVGVEIRGNVILNYEDENQPFRATLQGIGCFDGTFVDWVIENNVVITDHWHGITLLGARNSRIVNNTVIDVNEETPGPPWISIDDHKNGTPPDGCLVRNNLATDYASSATGVTEDHNFVVDDPFALFVDPSAYDLRLLATAAVIDQGTSDQAPPVDLDGIARPQGAAVDPGAFEWHEPGVTPVDGGAGVGASGAGGAAGGAGGAAGAGEAGANSAGAPGSGGEAPTGGGVSGGAVGGVTGGDAGPGGSSSSASDDSGCGCRSGPSPASPRGAWILGLGLIAATRRRRRAR